MRRCRRVRSAVPYFTLLLMRLNVRACVLHGPRLLAYYCIRHLAAAATATDTHALLLCPRFCAVRCVHFILSSFLSLSPRTAVVSRIPNVILSPFSSSLFLCTESSSSSYNTVQTPNDPPYPQRRRVRRSGPFLRPDQFLFFVLVFFSI